MDAVPAETPLERETVEDLVRQVRTRPGEFGGGAAMASRVAWSRARLERATIRHFHATPDALLREARLDRARELLATTQRTEGDIAAELGFARAQSLREELVRGWGLTPRAYRRMLGTRSWSVRLPADFELASTWRYLGRDAERTTEWVDGKRARRVLRHGRRRAVIEIEVSGDRLRAVVVGGRQPSPAALAAWHEQVWRWLGLGICTASFERRARRQRGWRELLRRQRGLRLPQTPTVYEGLVWALVGQQVNLAFAYRLRRVLAELCQASAVDGLRAHPTPWEIAELDYGDLTRRQFSRRKAEYVIDIARWIVETGTDLDGWRIGSATATADCLMALRGVGEWTQQYVLMRACGFGDCVPVGDAGLVKALRRFHDLKGRPDAEQTRALMAPLTPFRSLATAHLWASLHQEGDPA